MKMAKIFKFLKKGAKKAKKPGGAAEKSPWPEGTRIGVFGHRNSGKTVYFTVLYNEGKVTRKIQISVTDNETSAELLSNFRSIWGIAPAGGAGTIVDQRGEREFPDPTAGTRVLQFNAILDQKKKMPVVTLDYGGEAVSISGESDQAEKVKSFMASADGILFFFDPKIMGAEMEIQARASSYVNMLEKISPLKTRLPLPVGLVITKSDTLPGYRGEDQAVLIDQEDEQFLSENFDLFLEKVLGRVEGDREWAGTVRGVLVKLREFLRVVVGRTLDFQIFFISNTGNKPEKIGADVGRSIYKPPEKIKPSGVKEPFYWILNAIDRNKKLNVMRRVVKFVGVISVIWILLYSIPFLFNFNFLLPRARKVESSIMESADNNLMNTSGEQRGKIYRAYNRYGRKWVVREFFSRHGAAARNLADIYYNFDVGKAINQLDNIINEFAYIVDSRDLWPKYNPGKDSLIYDTNHQELLAGLERMHAGDEESILYQRSDRVLNYWNLFARFIKTARDSAVVSEINRQVDFDMNNAEKYSSSEKKLGEALLGLTAEKRQEVEAVAGLDDYDNIRDAINGSNDPAYLLGKAPGKLQAIRAKLNLSRHSKQISAIDSYLAEVNKWKRKRTYTCILESVPDMGHLHIEVTGSGQGPSWSKETQLLEGEEVRLSWKLGDDIHIAFDELKYPCTWGVKSSDKRVLQGRYALFALEGEVTFQNIGKTVTIRFKRQLTDMLPELK
ncbi:MAG: hypothetical protein R6U43_02595 [Candidatus Krumholzibacteriales bacterium]